MSAACAFGRRTALAIRRHGFQEVLSDGQVELLGRKLDGFADLPAIETMIAGQALLNKLAHVFLDLCQPAADGCFVNVK